MYGKIFADIFYSSLMCNGGHFDVYVMMSLVTLADENGVVPYDERALYRLLGLEPAMTFDEFADLIDRLGAPDPTSNLPAHEGRRIIPLCAMPDIDGDRGVWIVNYEHYRKKGSREDRKEQNRINKQNQRLRNNVINGQRSSAMSAHTDTDTDTDTDKRDHCASATHFDRFWEAYPRKTNKKQAREIWNRKKLDDQVDHLLEAVHRHCQSEQWQTPSLIPHPSTWLRGERWEDELQGSASVGGPL